MFCGVLERVQIILSTRASSGNQFSTHLKQALTQTHTHMHMHHTHTPWKVIWNSRIPGFPSYPRTTVQHIHPLTTPPFLKLFPPWTLGLPLCGHISCFLYFLPLPTTHGNFTNLTLPLPKIAQALPQLRLSPFYIRLQGTSASLRHLSWNPHLNVNYLLQTGASLAHRCFKSHLLRIESKTTP